MDPLTALVLLQIFVQLDEHLRELVKAHALSEGALRCFHSVSVPARDQAQPLDLAA